MIVTETEHILPLIQLHYIGPFQLLEKEFYIFGRKGEMESREGGPKVDGDAEPVLMSEEILTFKDEADDALITNKEAGEGETRGPITEDPWRVSGIESASTLFEDAEAQAHFQNLDPPMSPLLSQWSSKGSFLASSPFENDESKVIYGQSIIRPCSI